MSTPRIHARSPRETIEGIPVFSGADDYTSNYARIADDHLAETRRSGENPFIERQTWEDSERSTAELLSKYARDNDCVLDVGVGLGRLLARFPRLQRHGMDISLEYLKIARGNGIEVCLARIEDMPYEDGIFDVVVCTDVLEHVLDLNLCVRKIFQVLKQEGILIVRVPYRENLSSYLHPDYPYRYAHVRNFDEFGLALLFERVFNERLIECTTAGRTLDWTRLKYPLPAGNRVFAGLVRLVNRLLPPLGKALASGLFTPVVINVAVRKTAGAR